MPVISRLITLLAALLAIASACVGAERHVGAGREFPSLPAAVAAATSGDELLIHAGRYTSPCRIKLPLTVRAAGDGAVTLDGTGLDLIGDVATPRAMIEIHPAASGTRIEGLEIAAATNRAGNAAGIRVIDAVGVRIHGCTLRGCDNGLFSSGDECTLLVVDCRIEDNGSNTQAHNVYLSGGRRATLVRCRLATTVRGQNLKSRVADLAVIDSTIEDSGSRELDLVDGPQTGEHCLVLISGCRIAKRDGRGETDPARRVANRGMIHFGRDSRNTEWTTRGTLWLIDCELHTVHADPVVTLSTDGTRVHLVQCRLVNPGPERPGELALPQRLLDVRLGDAAGRLTLTECTLGPRFQ